MAGLLRSFQIVRSLRNYLADTSAYSRGLKQCRVVSFCKSQPLHIARYFSVHHKSAERVERFSVNKGLGSQLEKLNAVAQKMGSISLNMVKDAVSLLHECDHVSSSQALVLLRCCGSLMIEELPAARIELAHNIWKVLVSKGIPLDLSHYNGLLGVYIENEHDFCPNEFLDRLKEKGIEPNRVTYQRLVRRYGQLGDIEGTTKILETMKELGLPINENIFHSLIMVHARAGDLKSAKEIIEAMRQGGLEPTANTYRVLAVAQAEKGDVNGVKATIALGAETEETLQDPDLMDVIYALAANGHSDHVPEIMKFLKKDWGYNRDCKNLICRLLNVNCDDTARLLYSTMIMLADPESEATQNHGLFYVKHLIVRDKPLSSILSLCEDVSGNSAHLLQCSLEVAFSHNPKLVYPLMSAIQAKGAEIRPHFFWPLIVERTKNNDIEGVYSVLKDMKTRGVPITMATMVDYVLPTIMRNPSERMGDVIANLQKVGVSIPDICNHLIKYLIIQSDIASAVQLLQQYNIRVIPTVRRDLALATVRTRDYCNAAAVLGEVRSRPRLEMPAEEIHDSASSLLEEEQHSDAAMAEDTPGYITGLFLFDVHRRATEGFDWVALLKAMKDRGLSILKEHEASLSHALGPRATSEVNELLSALASGTLDKVNLERRPVQIISQRMKSTEQLEADLELCTSSGKDPSQILCSLLLSYAHTQEVEKAENVLKILEEDHQYPIGVGLRVTLINMYCGANLLQPALDMLEKIRVAEPDLVLKSSVLLRIAGLYVDAGRFQDAAAFLEDEGQRQLASGNDVHPPEDDNERLNLHFIRVLVPAAENGDVEMVARLQRAILDGQLAKPSHRLLSPIIRAHLVKGDLEAAFESLVECKKTFSAMPFKRWLAQEFIKNEDPNKLQQLVEMATDLYGEQRSLFDLACYFLNAERLKEAKQVFATPGLRIRSEHLDSACQYYVREKQTKQIELLLTAVANISSIDRRPIYQHLLQAYINDGNCEKALGLWTRMQEEDLPIQDKFLRDLGIFLQQNDKPVPFIIPQLPATPENSPQFRRDVQKQRPTLEFVKEIHPRIQEFTELLENGLLDEALSFFQKAKEDNQPIPTQGSLAFAEKLFAAGRLHETLDVFKETPQLQRRTGRGWGLLRDTFERLASQGDYDSVEDTVTNIGPLAQKSASLLLSKAAWYSKQPERYFDKIEKMIDEASSEDEISRAYRLYSPAGIIWLLQKDPTLSTNLEKLSEKLKLKERMDGVCSIWANHFINENPEFDKITAEVKESNCQFETTGLLHYCREMQDVTLVEKLISYIKANPSYNWGNSYSGAYNCLIGILCEKNAHDEALKAFEESLKDVDIELFHHATLKKLSENLASRNIEFPYKLPLRRTSAS